TYELENLDSRIKKYKASLEQQAYDVVLRDKRFSNVYASAKYWENASSFGESEDKISDAVSALSSYREVAEARSKDGNPIIENIVGRWAEAVFSNDRKTVAIQDAYSIEAL